VGSTWCTSFYLADPEQVAVSVTAFRTSPCLQSSTRRSKIRFATFWISVLARSFTWMVLLQRQGAVNRPLCTTAPTARRRSATASGWGGVSGDR